MMLHDALSGRRGVQIDVLAHGHVGGDALFRAPARDEADTLAMASAGSAGSTRSPSRKTCAGCKRQIWPKIARPTVWWPAPRRPTSPSVSPAATWKDTGPTRSATAPLDGKHDVASDAGAGRTKASLIERPTIISDELAGERLARGDGGDAASVAKDRDAVGDAKDLVEPMRDIDDADAARAEPPKRLEQALDIGFGQGRRRLVEHEDIRLDGERPADRDERALGRRKRRDRRRRDRGRCP